MTSTIVLSVIIFLLVVGLSVCIYRINLEKHYYRYTFNKSEKLEKELKDEQDKNSKMSERLNRVAYINTVSKIYNIDYFIAETSKMFTETPNAGYTLVTFNIANMGNINKLFGSDEGNRSIVYAADSLR